MAILSVFVAIFVVLVAILFVFVMILFFAVVKSGIIGFLSKVIKPYIVWLSRLLRTNKLGPVVVPKFAILLKLKPKFDKLFFKLFNVLLVVFKLDCRA